MGNKPNKTIPTHGQFVLTAPLDVKRPMNWKQIKVGKSGAMAPNHYLHHR